MIQNGFFKVLNTLLIGVMLLAISCSESANTEQVQSIPENKWTQNGFNEIQDGLYFKVEQTTENEKPAPNARVRLEYNLYTLDSSLVETSADLPNGKIIQFGEYNIIQGVELVAQQLKFGEQARAFIPNKLAYGNAANGKIEAGEDLLATVQLLEEVAFQADFDTTHATKIEMPSGLVIYQLNHSDGPKATPGTRVVLHYQTALVSDPTNFFDSSYSRGEPFEFVLGVGQVVPGFEEAISTMNQGERIKVLVPSYLAYGVSGVGELVLPNSDLWFNIELLKVNV